MCFGLIFVDVCMIMPYTYDVSFSGTRIKVPYVYIKKTVGDIEDTTLGDASFRRAVYVT